MDNQTTTEIAVSPPINHGNQNFLSPDVSMLLLTWVTFFLLLAVLYKFAWRPILSALEAREEIIRNSIENAGKIKSELDEIHRTRAAIIGEAEEKSRELLAQARKGAVETAKIIHETAKEEAHILLQNAQREIKAEAEKAQADLRQESARIAVQLAGRLIEKNLDDEKNSRLIEKFISEG